MSFLLTPPAIREARWFLTEFIHQSKKISIMEKNTKKAYVAPAIELVETRVEKGFAGSCLSNNTPDHCQIEGWSNEDAIFFFARVINLFNKLFSRQSPAIA